MDKENIDYQKRAESIKSQIVNSCSYISESDVCVTTDISRYNGYETKDGFVNRNSSNGELAYWVLVEVPEIPIIESDSYYQQNPHLKKPSKKQVERTKKTVEMIKAVCRQSAKSNNAEYIGYNTPSRGFDSSKGNTRYINICVE